MPIRRPEPQRALSQAEPLFVDTWGWLVFANRDDPAHHAVAALRKSSRLWITTDYVLDETITRLFSGVPFTAARRFVDAIFESAKQGSVTIEPITRARSDSAWRLRRQYQDKPKISFTDWTSFVVMQERTLTSVVTGDGHFSQVGFGFRLVPSRR